MTTTNNPRPRNRADLRSWYQSLLAQHASSNQSLKAFAGEQKLPLQNLYKWRKRLAQEKTNADSAQERSREKPGFIELDLHPGSGPDPDRDPRRYVVNVTGHCSLEIPMGFDSAEARTLFSMVQSC